MFSMDKPARLAVPGSWISEPGGQVCLAWHDMRANVHDMAFFEFLVSIYWYTITMKIEYDYRRSLNMTKLSQIDRIHVLVKGINQK